MRAATILCSALALTGCTAAVQPASPSPAPAPVSSKTVRYLSGTSRFRTVSHVHQEQKLQGKVQEANFTLEFFLTSVVGPQELTGMPLELVVDSVHAEGGLISQGEMDQARGIHLRGILGADGRIAGLTGDSGLTGQLQSLASSARQFFPRIPASGLEPGQRWADTTEIQVKGATDLTIRSINQRRALDWTQMAGHRAVGIEVVSNYTIAGTGQQMGQHFTLEGRGFKSTRQFLSAEGQYLGSNSRDSSSFDVNLSAVGMVFPSIQIRSDTVSLLP